ncbi:endonuclease-reverse transcriptase [Plakobranchus ocellatus]|uniref:Endonuclease-reverse transcriptase n=1 Tax=Plakobranchus ocellatus TaxID=259542 RepID=A0AAV4BV66_9GAST|nr:endonuclease-reverse transcriptase [Plakobranchus ocellatus]
MTDALEDHRGTVSIGGRPITNLWFADDIDGLAGNECELASLVEQLDKASSNFGVEINAEKTKIMTNSKEPLKKEIKVNCQILETITKFKYLGSIISDKGSKPEILSRIAQTLAALTKLKPIWNNKNIAISSKIRLLRSLVMSIFLYACESWTLNADIERRIRAMEMRCYRRLLGISYKDHTTNEEVSRKIENATC